MGKIEFITGRFETIAPKFLRNAPRHRNCIDETGVWYIRPRNPDAFAPDPFPEIWHEVPGIKTGQDLAVNVVLLEFLCGLRTDGNHAGEPVKTGCDDLCRKGARKENAVELTMVYRIDECHDRFLPDC